jgi:hypothetical protein
MMRVVQRAEAAGAGTFLSSQSTITCAMASLFFSIIIMWPLPRGPISASWSSGGASVTFCLLIAGTVLRHCSRSHWVNLDPLLGRL